MSRPAWWTPRCATSLRASAARWCTAPRNSYSATGTCRRRRRAPSRAAGSTAATSATIDAEGYLAIVDRTKDLINTGGVLVASREVEEALFTHPSVAEVAVIAVPDPKWIEAVAAVVVLRGDAPADIEAVLLAHARLASGRLQGSQAHHPGRRPAEEHRRQAAEAGATSALCRHRERRPRRGVTARRAAAMVRRDTQ